MLAGTIQQALEAAPTVAKEYEIIIVNDGSQDRTAEIADHLAQENSCIRVIHHQKNQGYGGALQSGLYNARYGWIFFSDSDGQFDLNELTNFAREVHDADLVIGYRLQRAEGFGRILNAKLWSGLMRLLFGLKVKDVDCAFKLIRREVIERIPRLESNGALISAELLIKAQRAGFKIKELGVGHFKDEAGGSTGANPKVILRAFQELWKLRKEL